MSFIKGIALKVYDPELPDDARSDYWEKKMQGTYFSNPALFLKVISNSTFFSFLSEFLPDEGLFLDGGCGSNYLANLFDTDSRKIVGLDFAAESLIRGKEVYPDSLAVCGDLNALPFNDASFDGVFFMSSAEHLESGPTKLFEEAHRVLKKDGVLLVFIPTYSLEDVVASILHKDADLMAIPHFEHEMFCKVVREIKIENQKGFFAYWFSGQELKGMLKRAGFTVESVFPLDVMGGLVRSRIFGRSAKKYLTATMLKMIKLTEGSQPTWLERIFVKEQIYGKKLDYFIHCLVGFFYRYAFAFVCRRQS